MTATNELRWYKGILEQKWESQKPVGTYFDGLGRFRVKMKSTFACLPVPKSGAV